MDYKLISTHTKSYTVAYSFGDSLPVGSVVTNEYAMISRKGDTSREYMVSKHEGCENNGLRFCTMEAWSDDSHCTGCDLYEYHGISD